jgi:hypothetical protein
MDTHNVSLIEGVDDSEGKAGGIRAAYRWFIGGLR